MGGAWQNPMNLGGVVNTNSNESPCWVSGDGRILVFKSDRPGGYGQQDFYYTTQSGGRWTAPVNLGSVLNTSGDESGASFRCNRNVIGGLIYLGSTRSGGQGGRDLWTAEDSEFHAVAPASLGRVKALFW